MGIFEIVWLLLKVVIALAFFSLVVLAIGGVFKLFGKITEWVEDHW